MGLQLKRVLAIALLVSFFYGFIDGRESRSILLPATSVAAEPVRPVMFEPEELRVEGLPENYKPLRCSEGPESGEYWLLAESNDQSGQYHFYFGPAENLVEQTVEITQLGGGRFIVSGIAKTNSRESHFRLSIPKTGNPIWNGLELPEGGGWMYGE